MSVELLPGKGTGTASQGNWKIDDSWGTEKEKAIWREGKLKNRGS